MKLKEILDGLIGKEVSMVKIGKHTLFPHDNGYMHFETFGVTGYYNVMTDKKVLLCLSIRKQGVPAGEIEYENLQFSVTYENDETIRSISVNHGEYTINFKI